MLVAIVTVGFSINAYTSGRKCTGSKTVQLVKIVNTANIVQKKESTCGVCR